MSTIEAKAPAGVNTLYFAAWRWHFYAGLFVLPLLLMLALTGGFMMIYADRGNELGQAPDVLATGPALAPSTLAQRALEAVPGGSLLTYIAPESPTRPAYFEVSRAGATLSVAVDPVLGRVTNLVDESKTWRALAEEIHGTLLLGTLGDRLIETAASLSMLLIVSGLYLWWPRQGLRRALLPRLGARGRGLWKELHRTVGFWTAAVLFVFMLTGLSWTGVWGDLYAKPWGGFPASKWENVPLSDVTHAALNHSALHNVPWTLESTPLPASGSEEGQPGVAQPVVIDTVVQWALRHGFAGQFRLALPSGETGVYTLSVDARNGDGFTPADDRFVHIDRYTGHILADVPYADYPLLGKAMAWGVGLHKGQAGPVNFWGNLIYLGLVIFLCVSGVVLWWKRRPAGIGRLAAPPLPADLPMWKGAVLVALATALAFPMAGVALLIVLTVDLVVLANLPVLKRALS